MHLNRGRNKKELGKKMYYLALEKLSPVKKILKTSLIHCPFPCVTWGLQAIWYRNPAFLSGHPVTAAKLGDIMKGLNCIWWLRRTAREIIRNFFLICRMRKKGWSTNKMTIALVSINNKILFKKGSNMFKAVLNYW